MASQTPTIYQVTRDGDICALSYLSVVLLVIGKITESY
jgi:hypothetical protein